MSTDAYTTLLTSLPYPGELFKAKQTPLSRLKLDSRLRMLSEEDAALLGEVEGLVHWINQPMERTDAAFVAHAQRLIPSMEDAPLKEVVLVPPGGAHGDCRPAAAQARGGSAAVR